MQPAEDGGAHDLCTGRQAVRVALGIDREPLGRVGNAWAEARVGAVVVVVGDVLVQDAAEVVLAERDDVVEAVATDRADQAFAERVRPGHAVGSLQRPHTEAPDGLVDLAVEGAGPVVDEVAVGVVGRDGLSELVADPVCGGARGDVGVEDPAAAEGRGYYQVAGRRAWGLPG